MNRSYASSTDVSIRPLRNHTRAHHITFDTADTAITKTARMDGEKTLFLNSFSMFSNSMGVFHWEHLNVNKNELEIDF